MTSGIEQVLAFLKKQNIEIKPEIEASISKEFEDRVLAPPERVLAEGEVAIKAEWRNEKVRDIAALKEKLKSAERERDELAGILEAGDGDAKGKLEKIVIENKRLKNLADAHLSEKKELWKQTAEKIPEPMKRFFAFAGDGKELTDEEILANVSKLKEYADIGAIKLDGEPSSPSASRVPPGGGERLPDRAAWEKLPPTEKIARGYKEAEKASK